LRVDGSHVTGREDIRQEQRLFVSYIVRNLDGANIGHRHPKVFGLAARIAAEHVAEPKKAGGRLSHCFSRNLSIGIGSIAARKQALLTKPALAATDGEGRDDPITNLQVRDFGSKLDNLAHILVAEDVAALHGRLITIKQMEIRAADSTRRDLYNGVAGMLDLRIRDRIDPDVAFSVPA
jgi:hypothetical protein